MAYKSNVTPQQDTGWGVIYRLNDLFREIEVFAPLGKYDEWNFKLDRIFSNLCYRSSFKIIKDTDDKIISIEFDEDSYNIKMFLDSIILKSKSEMATAKRQLNEGTDYTKNIKWIQGKKKLYKAIFMKEIWLRKYMQELGLYLKEIESNPAGAMFGK